MKTIVIAEAGVNHNGKLHIAKKMVDHAKRAGADYIKFQSFDSNEIVTESAKKAEYQLEKNDKETQYQMLKKLEINKQFLNQIVKYSKKKKIKFLSTAFDEKSLKLLEKYKLDYIKIPSGEITNYPLLKQISMLKKKVLLSTGMASLSEIRQALKVFRKKKDITILHCTSDYPANLKDLNLNFIKKLKKFGCEVGYSDHSSSIITPSIAVSLGCKVVEKHFTLSKNLKGPDHKASLEPQELKRMISLIRDTEKMLGSNNKIITKSEQKTKLLVRKSLVAKNDIKKRLFHKGIM